MSEHLTWCKSLQGGTAIDCNCAPQRKIIWERYDTEGAMEFSDEKHKQLTAENARLRKAIEDVRHKGYCATVKYACKGIEIEKDVFSGCAGLSDCPECNGVKHTCSCGIDDWKDSVLNNNRNALEKP